MRRPERDERADGCVDPIAETESSDQSSHTVRDHDDVRRPACRRDVLNRGAETTRGDLEVAAQRPIVVADGVRPTGRGEPVAERPQARSGHPVARNEHERRPRRRRSAGDATPGYGAEWQREHGDDGPERLQYEIRKHAGERARSEGDATHLRKVHHLVERHEEADELRDDDRGDDESDEIPDGRDEHGLREL